MKTNQRGMALLMVLMVIAALLVLAQMVLVLMDNVAQRSGTFRRLERGSDCAEEGLALAKAWVAQNQANGTLTGTMLSGSAPPPNGATAYGTYPPTGGLLADPTDPNDLKQRDLCTVPAVNGGVPSLLGLCRYQPGTTNNLYRINLVDDVDEPPTGGSPKLNPWVDSNGTIILRAECLSTDAAQYSSSGTVETDATVSVEYIQVPTG